MSASGCIAVIRQTEETAKLRFETLIIKGCRAIKRGTKGVASDQYSYALETALTCKSFLIIFAKKIRNISFVLLQFDRHLHYDIREVKVCPPPLWMGLISIGIG